MIYSTLVALLLALVMVSLPLANATVYYNAVAMDRSAKTIYASSSEGIFVSTDAGKTWTKSSSCGTPSSIEISDDGQYAMVVYDPAFTCGPVQVTSNYGKTWTKPSFPLRAYTIPSGDVSGSGQYMVAVSMSSGNGNDEIYVSTDYGNTFTATPHTDCINLYSAAMSRSADKIFVGQGVGLLFQSKDFGTSFNRMNTVPSSGLYSRMECDEDCSYIVAATTNGVAVSADFGNSWNTTSLPRNSGYKISVSSNGQHQYAAGNLQHVFHSADYGQTWLASQSPLSNWVSVDCDPTGQNVVASSSDKGIYLSSDFGNTWTLAKL